MIPRSLQGGLHSGERGRWPLALGVNPRPSLGRHRPLGETLGRVAWLALASLAYGPSPFSISPLLFNYLINLILIFNYFN
jgi:hypothetical protein